MKTAYLVFLVIYLGGLAVRAFYELLKKAGKINPRNIIIFAGILTVMLLLWTSWFNMCPLDPVKIAIPSLLRWAGIIILILGLALAIGALIQLRGVENIDHLVTSRLFARIRHPMYLGFIFWIFGWVIFHGAVISLVAGLVGIGNILYWRHLEEKDLEAAYGDEYRNYRSRTWF